MDKMLDSVFARRSSLGTQYEEKLQAALAQLWERKQLILKIVAVALALGILAAFAMPARYTAEAYVHGGLAAPYAVTAGQTEGGGQAVNFDASLLVETRSRLLQSHQLARRVVEQLGLDRLRPEVGASSFSSWLQVLLYGVSAKAPAYQVDRAAARLVRGLSVKTEPRVYRIAVRYTASEPELAAQITNAFIIEFLRLTALQTLSEQRVDAQKALSGQLALFGEKHPRVAAAKARVAAADAFLKAQLGKSLEEVERTAGENVTFAQPIAVPSSPNHPLLIGISLFLGLVVSIGSVLWMARDSADLQGPQAKESSNGARTPGSTSPLEDHPEFLLRLIEQNPDLTLDQALTALRTANIKSNGGATRGTAAASKGRHRAAAPT